jgi:hypothetical protein
MTRPLVRTRTRRYRFIRLASSGSAASLSVDWNQIKRELGLLPSPNQPRLAGVGQLYICRKRASPQPAGVGLGVGVEVRTRQTCPQRTKSGRSAIVRSCRRSVALPVQCALPPRKPSASSGGICATEFLRLAHISGGRFELAATSPILPVTRHALSSRSMAASTERGQPPMNNGPKLSKRAVPRVALLE